MEEDKQHIIVDAQNNQYQQGEMVEMAQLKREENPEIILQSHQSFESSVHFSIDGKQIDEVGGEGESKKKSSGSDKFKDNQPVQIDIPLGISKQQSSSIIQAFTEIKQAIETDQQIQKVIGADQPPETKLKQSKKSKKADKKAIIKEKFRYMDDHKIELQQLFSNLGLQSFEQGLSNQKVEENLLRDGDNLLTETTGKPWYILFIKQLTGFFSLLLWGGGILCFVGYALAPSDPTNLYLGIVLCSVVLVTGIFSFYQDSKSASIMASFKNFVPPQTLVIREGGLKQIPASKIVKGDVVEIRPGDRIPADIRVLEAHGMKVDNSSLTGENLALKRSPNLTSDNPLETENLIFFGTLCKEGTCRGTVINVGDNTVIGQIANMAQTTVADETPISKEIKRFIKIISAVAIVLGIVFFIFGIAYGYDVITDLVFCIGIIVANVPEGLLATVTVSLTLTAQRMAKKQVLVKNLESVETLGSTTCICSDKTGTLTQNLMSVSSLWYDKKKPIKAITKEDLEEWEQPQYDINSPSFKMLQVIAVVNNKGEFDYSLPSEKQLTDKEKAALKHDPVKISNEENKRAKEYQLQEQNKKWKERKVNSDASENALVKFFQPIEDVIELRKKYQKALALEDKPAIIPFSSSHKYALTIVVDAERSSDYLFLIKGAPEKIWQFCQKTLCEQQEQNKDESWEDAFKETNFILGKRGERVLGFAYMYYPKEHLNVLDMDQIKIKIESMEFDFIFTGLISLMDPPRTGVPDAVAKCRSAGIKVIMITGDQPVTAESIAKDVGIITGKTNLDVLSENNIDLSKIEDPVERERLEDWAIEQAQCIIIHGDKLARECGKDESKPEEEKGQVLEQWLLKRECSFARTTPAQKLIIVEGCQKLKHIVAVTGDGVNDSPAMKKADIGIAMGKVGSDVAKDAADMLLLNDDFTAIVDGVEEGRIIFDNLKKSIAYTLTSNIPEIAPFIIFICIQIPLPLSTVLILCIDLGTDLLPAISMAYEGGELDIMRRKPRNAQVDHLVNTRLIHWSYLQIGVIQAVAGFYTFFLVLNDYGFYPTSLIFMASMEGIKPNKNDIYNPLDKFKGNSNAWNEFLKHPEGFDTKQDKVDFNTNKDNEYDLRIWYLDMDENSWAECRIHRDSYVSSKSICYTTEALRHAQSAYFVSIVTVQWGCLIVSKSRKLSISQQGMNNQMLNFSLFFETALAAFICYEPHLAIGLGSRDLQFEHFSLPSFPWFIIIFFYDEIRKSLIRGARARNKNKAGLVESYTYW